MRITEIDVQHFRSIYSLRFNATSLTAICGPNSCGKSNILRAIKFAFLPSYSPERMLDNICHNINSPNAECKVKISFDRPTSNLAVSLNLPTNKPFTYSVAVKRNGSKKAHINSSPLSDERRNRLLDQVMVIHVPPIRDISADGLRPFKDTLAAALRKTRGSTGFTTLNKTVRDYIQERGKNLLDGTKDVARDLLRVDELIVKTDAIELEQLLPATAIGVRIGRNIIDLDKLGTGHQSSVILKLYKQLGAKTDKFVLYLFEEPDNHLHPTSLRAISEDLLQAANEANTQVFLTTHSPYLLNQFNHECVIALASDPERQTIIRPKHVIRSDRDVRIALGRYGLKPAEALLANKVVIVEGPNDVTFLRTLIELKTKLSPDRQDILIIPAGGKGPVVDLAGFLMELGVNWRAFFDWDATESTSAPLFRDNLIASDIQRLQIAANEIRAELRNLPTRQSKATKLVDAMLGELGNAAPVGKGFMGSVLENFLSKHMLLNKSEGTALRAALKGRQPRKWSGVLSPKNIWLWSDAIEGVMLRSNAAEKAAESVLRNRKALQRKFSNTADCRNAMMNIIHSSAHEPELVRDVIEALWDAGHFDKSEVKSAIKFMLD